jgi:predicted dehydrogenase/nucleoside-diphosphate-sugar epimerase
VVGCGAIAEKFHLPALASNERTRDGIFLVDPNNARRAAMREKFHAVGEASAYQELLGQVDGVIVATPPLLHFESAQFFLKERIPVLCEKPLSESSAEVRELLDISRRTGAALGVNQTRRFFPTYQKIRQLIAEGKLGTLKSITYHDGVEFNWPAASPHHFQPSAKGVWSDTGVHLLDAVCYWLNAKPKLISSENDSFGGPEALATVRLAYGECQVEIKVSRLGRLINGFRIIGTGGTIAAEAEDWDEFDLALSNGKTERYHCASNHLKFNDFAKPMLQNFIEVIEGKSLPAVSGESTLGTVELLEEAYAAPTKYAMPWNGKLPCWRESFPTIRVDEPVRRVLVTGASGFVGGRLVEAMAFSQLFQPVSAIRSWSRAARPAAHPVEIVICDIMNTEQVDRTVANVQGVIHCAYTDNRRDIVEGTRNLLEASAKHGVRDFVFLSTAEVYGPELHGDVSEDAPIAPTGRLYGDAKLEAEGLCREFAKRGVFVSILRPSLVYGPFGKSFSIDIVKRLQSGKWGLFDDLGEGIANLIYVDDLVRATFLCLTKSAEGHRTFNVNGPDRPTWNEYFQLVNDKLGRPPLRRLSSANSKFKAIGMDLVRKVTSSIKARFEDQLMEIYLRGGRLGNMMKRLKGELDATPSGRELSELFSRKANYIDQKIRNELGYSPTVNLQEGVECTLQWMKLHEHLEHDVLESS